MISASLLHSNDRLATYPPSWYAATATGYPDTEQLTGAHEADIAIIGGGFTGLSAALHLSKR
ncbi:MAG: FAD-dependent oxidoreductase, partial [Proteobacteria bacterium]|nr:FAD-dependent oxidoreductase [Pseudomonadota bacterium]